MTTAAKVIHQDGMVLIRSDVDQAFRKALLDGAPPSLRPKMVDALSAQIIPNTRRAQREARRYFGKEADEIFGHAADFAEALHKYLSEQFDLVGLLDWLSVTGYGNDYRMIRVFAEWARLSREASLRKIATPPSALDG